MRRKPSLSMSKYAFRSICNSLSGASFSAPSQPLGATGRQLHGQSYRSRASCQLSPPQASSLPTGKPVSQRKSPSGWGGGAGAAQGSCRRHPGLLHPLGRSLLRAPQVPAGVHAGCTPGACLPALGLNVPHLVLTARTAEFPWPRGSRLSFSLGTSFPTLSVTQW